MYYLHAAELFLARSMVGLHSNSMYIKFNRRYESYIKPRTGIHFGRTSRDSSFVRPPPTRALMGKAAKVSRVPFGASFRAGLLKDTLSLSSSPNNHSTLIFRLILTVSIGEGRSSVKQEIPHSLRQ